MGIIWCKEEVQWAQKNILLLRQSATAQPTTAICLNASKRQKSLPNRFSLLLATIFFGGEKEDLALLHQTYAEHPDCEFIEIAHTKDRLYNRYINRSPKDNDWQDFWHSTTRYVPFFFLKEAIEYILFLDSDEIIEGKKFAEWLEGGEHLRYDAIRFLQYYYFREARYRAKDFQTGGLMAKKSAVKPFLLMNTDDRCGIFHAIAGDKKEGLSFENSPMIHHYSWVKTEAECLLKADNWGHHWEKDWKSLIKEEFSRDFNGRDFIDNRPYVIDSNPYFDPLSVPVVRKKVEQRIFPHVRKVDDHEIKRRELAFEFNIPYTP